MIKQLATISSLLRRAFGTEKLVEKNKAPNERLNTVNRGLHDLSRVQYELKGELKAQSRELERTASYLEFSQLDEVRMKQSLKHQNMCNIISLLSPMDVTGEKHRRIGRSYNGGYIMVDDFTSKKKGAAYSLGISTDASWDEDIAEMGIPLYIYDHTIDELPKQHPYFNFFKEGVPSNREEKGLETRANFINRNGHPNAKHLLLKADIEGYAWSIFEETSSSVVNQFSQIVFELHGLNPNGSKKDLSKITSVLEKINGTHQPVHVHAIGFCAISCSGNLLLPHFMEITYVRKSNYSDKLVTNSRSFPTDLDDPTIPWLTDITSQVCC